MLRFGIGESHRIACGEVSVKLFEFWYLRFEVVRRAATRYFGPV